MVALDEADVAALSAAGTGGVQFGGFRERDPLIGNFTGDRTSPVDRLRQPLLLELQLNLRDAQSCSVEITPMLIKIRLQRFVSQVFVQVALPGQLPDERTTKLSFVDIFFLQVIFQRLASARQVATDLVNVLIDFLIVNSDFALGQVGKDQLAIGQLGHRPSLQHIPRVVRHFTPAQNPIQFVPDLRLID